MSDARYEDGGERPLRLIARDIDDLRVISALVQDAVLTGADLTWQRRSRRFALLVNRFRWENHALAAGGARPAERVRAVLDFGDVRRVSQQGLDQRGPDTVLSLMAIDFSPQAADTPRNEPAGPGRLTLVFAGDGAIALDVECLEVHLADVTRPYGAPARRAPAHRIDD